MARDGKRDSGKLRRVKCSDCVEERRDADALCALSFLPGEGDGLFCFDVSPYHDLLVDHALRHDFEDGRASDCTAPHGDNRGAASRLQQPAADELRTW